MYGILNSKNYKGGTEGILIIHLDCTNKIYHYRIRDLK